MHYARDAATALILAIPACGTFQYAQAQSTAPVSGPAYPSRPIRYVIPDNPGGASDIIGRIFADSLTETLGQKVLPDNRPGAGTTIAINIAAKSKPDGYTILQIGPGFAAAPSLYRDLPYDSARDLIAVTQLTKSPLVIVANRSLPVRSVAQLVALAKARPGALDYASGGVGTNTFFAAELFKARTGVDMLHVQYRGGGPAMTAVVSGETTLYFAPVAAVLPFLGNRLHPLAVTTLQRLRLLPEVPTVNEAGYPGYEAGNWNGLMVPAGTPGEIAAAIQRSAQTVLGKLNKRLGELAYIPVGSQPDEYAAFLADEIKNTAQICQRLGLKPI